MMVAASRFLFGLPTWTPAAVANAVESLTFFESPSHFLHSADSSMKDFFNLAEAVQQTFPQDQRKKLLRQRTNLSHIQWAFASDNRYALLHIRRGAAQAMRGLKPSEMLRLLQTLQKRGNGTFSFRDTAFMKPVAIPVLPPISEERPSEEVTKLCPEHAGHFCVPDDDLWSNIPGKPGFSVLHISDDEAVFSHALIRNFIDGLYLSWLVRQTRRWDDTRFLAPKPIRPQSIESAMSDLTHDANLLPHFRFLLRAVAVEMPSRRPVSESFWPVIWAPSKPRSEAELQVYMKYDMRDEEIPPFLPYKRFVRRVVGGIEKLKNRFLAFIPMEIPSHPTPIDSAR